MKSRAGVFAALAIGVLGTTAKAEPALPAPSRTPSDHTAPAASAADAEALALLPLLADPDPAIRDGRAYGRLTELLRGDQISEPTRRALLAALTAVVEAGAQNDPTGVHRPFAALVLSEVARTDRIAAWLTSVERAALVATAARYLSGVRDYRGFDEREGWRHGVAHGADLLLQLVINPAVDRAQIETLLAAVAGQVAPAGHAYVYGEPRRLARPVLLAASRHLLTGDEWSAWLRGVADPAPLASWNDAFASQRGLAALHDVRAFLLALYLGARESGDPELEAALLPGLRETLRSLP